MGLVCKSINRSVLIMCASGFQTKYFDLQDNKDSQSMFAFVHLFAEYLHICSRCLHVL